MIFDLYGIFTVASIKNISPFLNVNAFFFKKEAALAELATTIETTLSLSIKSHSV